MIVTIHRIGYLSIPPRVFSGNSSGGYGFFIVRAEPGRWQYHLAQRWFKGQDKSRTRISGAVPKMRGWG